MESIGHIMIMSMLLQEGKMKYILIVFLLLALLFFMFSFNNERSTLEINKSLLSKNANKEELMEEIKKKVYTKENDDGDRVAVTHQEAPMEDVGEENDDGDGVAVTHQEAPMEDVGEENDDGDGVAKDINLHPISRGNNSNKLNLIVF